MKIQLYTSFMFVLALVSACGPTEQEKLEAEKRAADSLAAAKEMMDAAKEAALIQSQIKQKEIIDSLARNPDTTKISADTSKAAK
jgi:spore coat polysaccharide biosynthesis protein SpsF (cytidylyltransferase family)